MIHFFHYVFYALTTVAVSTVVYEYFLLANIPRTGSFVLDNYGSLPLKLKRVCKLKAKDRNVFD